MADLPILLVPDESQGSQSFKIEDPNKQSLTALPLLTPENLRQQAIALQNTSTNKQGNGNTNYQNTHNAASLSLFGPFGNDSNNNNNVVEKYVLSEMGAVSELDEAVEKAKKILENSLYQCARHSLFHIAQNREELQRQQRDFDLEKLRQDLESKKLEQKADELKRREANLRKREDVMLQREELLMSRDRALERIQIFAHEDLRRQRLISIANVELSEVVLEHVRRVELTAASSAPQQFFLSNVSKYLQGYNENLKNLASSPSSRLERATTEDEQQQHQQEEENQQQQQLYHHHQESAEEMLVRSLHSQQSGANSNDTPTPKENNNNNNNNNNLFLGVAPRPPLASKNKNNSNYDYSLSSAKFRQDQQNQVRKQLQTAQQQQQNHQQNSIFFSTINIIPSLFYKMQRDFSLDLCPLHLQGARAIHVVREVPLLQKPTTTTSSQLLGATDGTKNNNNNSLASAAGKQNPYLISTSSTAGQCFFNIELFHQNVLKSFILVGDPFASPVSSKMMNMSGRNYSNNNNNLINRNQSMEVMKAFQSPCISFVYFAPKNNHSNNNKYLGGFGYASSDTQNQFQEPPSYDREKYILEDSIVLVVATTTTTSAATTGNGTAGKNDVQPSSSSASTSALRPQSAPVSRNNGNSNHNNISAGSSGITVHSILARVPLSKFLIEQKQENNAPPPVVRPSSASLNNNSNSNSTTTSTFAAQVDLRAKTLIVKRLLPKNKWRLHSNTESENAKQNNQDEILAAKFERALVRSGQATGDNDDNLHQENNNNDNNQNDIMPSSSGNKPEDIFTSVISFDDELAKNSSQSARAAILNSDASIYIGVLLTSPCGAVEFLKVDTESSLLSEEQQQKYLDQLPQLTTRVTYPPRTASHSSTTGSENENKNRGGELLVSPASTGTNNGD